MEGVSEQPNLSISRRGMGVAVVSSLSLSACSLVDSEAPTQQRSGGAPSSPGAAPTSGATATSGATPAPADHVISKAFAHDPGLELPGMKAGTLGAPHLSFTIQAMTASAVPSLWAWQVAGGAGASAEAIPAAAGQEWRLVVLRPWAPMTVTDEHSGVGRVKAGKADIDLTPLVGGHQKMNGFTGKVVALAISIPKGSAGTLTVVDEKRTATFDLLAVTPSDDADTRAMAVSARVTTTTAKPTEVSNSATWSDGTNSGGVTVTMTIDPDACFVTPWHPTPGWAKAGRAWFVAGHVTTASYDKWTVQVVIDPTKQITLTAGNQKIPAQGSTIDLLKNISRTQPEQLLFEVPEGFAGGTLTMVLPPSFVMTYKEGIKRPLALKAKGPLTTALTVTTA